MRILSRLFWRVLDWLDYRIWDARLRMVDAMYGPPEPETEAGRARESSAPGVRIEEAEGPARRLIRPDDSARSV